MEGRVGGADLVIFGGAGGGLVRSVPDLSSFLALAHNGNLFRDVHAKVKTKKELNIAGVTAR